MSTLWPPVVEPPDRVLVAARSWGPLLDRWAPTAHRFIHVVSWMDPTWARKEAYRLVLLAASRARRDEAADFWAVLRPVVVEFLEASVPAYLDWLEADDVAASGVAALRRLSPRELMLLLLYDDDDGPSRHDEGRFRAGDLTLLLGLAPSSVRAAAHAAGQRLERRGSVVTAALDLVRAPTRVGETVPPVTDGSAGTRPAFEARSVIAAVAPRPGHRPDRTWPLDPPDPLGRLKPGEPFEPVPAPVERAAARRRWTALLVAAAVVSIAIALGGYVSRRDREGGGGPEQVASQTAPTGSTGSVRTTQLSWGPAPSVCPHDQDACYAVGVVLEGYPPGRQLEVQCVISNRPGPGAKVVTIGDAGNARTHVPCADDRSARSIDVTVDGEVSATIDLPTTIVPAPP